MTVTGTATVSIEVATDPATAFRVFTEKIGTWYRPGTYYWADPDRAKLMKLEPGVGGRVLEVYDEAGEDFLEIGRVIVWEPGRRLVLRWVHSAEDTTDIEVRFEPIETGTKVTLEHSGWDRVARSVADERDNYRQAWTDLLGWYSETLDAA